MIYKTSPALFSSITLMSVLLSIPLSARADIITLKNGDRISGVLLSSETANPLILQSLYGAEMNIPADKIERIEREQTAEILSNFEPVAGVENNPDHYEWSGRVNIGAALDDGNSQKKALNAEGETTARNADNRWLMGGDLHYANDEGAETDNDQSLYGEYNRFHGDKWFYGARQKFKKDKIAALELRSTTGPFTGYQFFEQDDLNLKIRIGANYIFEKYDSGNREEHIAAAWGFDYDQKVWDDTLGLFHNHTLDVPVDATDAFLFESASGIRIPVGKYLTGTAQIDFDWNNDPAVNTREGDTTYALKLGYEW